MKVGDYARTCYGTIFKIENITEIDVDGEYFKSKVKKNSVIKDLPNFIYEEGEILNKTSPNIIDLIEVGDYVNEEKVLEVLIDRNMSRIKTELSTFFNDEIKSIVTKEQFSQMKYKIGE